LTARRGCEKGSHSSGALLRLSQKLWRRVHPRC
jgi:hypothetical protein